MLSVFCCFISYIQNESYRWRISQLQHPSYIRYMITVALTAVGQSQSSKSRPQKNESCQNGPNKVGFKWYLLELNLMFQIWWVSKSVPKKLHPENWGKMNQPVLTWYRYHCVSVPDVFVFRSLEGSPGGPAEVSCMALSGGREHFWTWHDITIHPWNWPFQKERVSSNHQFFEGLR